LNGWLQAKAGGNSTHPAKREDQPGRGDRRRVQARDRSRRTFAVVFRGSRSDTHYDRSDCCQGRGAAASEYESSHLSPPHELVFDEVTFGWPGAPLQPLIANGETSSIRYPPLAKVLLPLGIKLLGDVPWAWRIGVASHGYDSVWRLPPPPPYLLGRRIFRSRKEARLAASFVLTTAFSWSFTP